MKRHQQGVALLEALVATLLLAIGLLGAIGLQARAYAALSESSMRAEATIATEQLLGTMSNDVPNLAKYKVAAGATPDARLKAWYDDTKVRIPGAAIVVAVADAVGVEGTQVDITITWTRRAGEQPNVHTVTSYIRTSS